PLRNRNPLLSEQVVGFQLPFEDSELCEPIVVISVTVIVGICLLSGFFNLPIYSTQSGLEQQLLLARGKLGRFTRRRSLRCLGRENALDICVCDGNHGSVLLSEK